MSSNSNLLLSLVCLCICMNAVDAGNEGPTTFKGNQYFSIPAFFITFRESMEACVIVSILLKFVERIGRPEMKKDIWWGCALGMFLAILAGMSFVTIFYVVGTEVLQGKQEQIFEGCLMLLASIVITVLAMAMLSINKFQDVWERKLKADLKKAEARGGSLRNASLFWLSFATILREGMEAALFLGGVGAGYSYKAIPIPAICGLIAGFILGWSIYKLGNVTSIGTFLKATTVLLMFMGAGLASRAADEFGEAGMFGTEENVWTTPVWNICACCDETEKQFWALFRALLGYTCDPNPWEIFSYLFYWLVALTYMAYKLRLMCFKNIPLEAESEKELPVTTDSIVVKDGDVLVKEGEKAATTPASSDMSPPSAACMA